MGRYRWQGGWEKPLWLVIFLYSSFFMFKKLDNIYLWEDEAVIAVIARDIANYVPTPLPPADIHLVALSFLVFGPTTLAARFPFALIGLLSIPMLYILGRRLFADRCIGLTAALLLSTSVPYLLHMRQGRYYALASFLTLSTLYFYSRSCLLDRRLWAAPLFVLSGTLLFYTHYSIFAGTILGLGGFHLLFLFQRDQLKWILLIMGGLGLLLLPWLLSVDLFTTPLRIEDKIYFLQYYVVRLGRYIFPPLLLVILLLFTKRLSRKAWAFLGGSTMLIVLSTGLILPKSMYFMATLFCLALWLLYKNRHNLDPHLVLLLMVCTAIVGITALFIPWDYFRFIIGCFPLLYLVMAYLFRPVWVKSKALALVLLVLIVGSDALATVPFVPLRWVEEELVTPWLQETSILSASTKQRIRMIDERLNVHGQIHFPILDFWYELNHDYDGPIEGLVKYLTQHGKAGQTIKIDYGAAPVMFYTDLQVLPVTKEAILEEPLSDWVVLRATNWMGIPLTFRDALKVHYEEIILDVPDIPWENRPDPEYHHYRTAKNAPRLVVYRLR